MLCQVTNGCIMSTLNRLISVLLARSKKISLEDAADDVAQYFDEISTSEPVPVQPVYTADQLVEQTAEVTGLSRPSIQELLDNKEGYIPYLNQTGRSNVEGFKVGDDWVMVMFKDYSYYLYTRQSCTEFILQSIKDLAVRGQGLNGYINKMVRSDYAARQKGINTLIRPGMESFDDRLLHLLIAYKRTTHMNQPSVANEGFFESIKKAFGISNKGTVPKLWQYASNIPDILSNLKSHFGNPQWLDKQTFVTGPVDNTRISDVLSTNGKVDILAALKASDEYNKLCRVQKAGMGPYQAKVKPGLDLLIKNANNLSDADFDQVKKIVAEARKLPPVKVNWPSNPLTGKATYKSERNVNAVYAPVDVKINALTDEQVRQVTALMMKSLEEVTAGMFKLPDLPEKLDRFIWTSSNNPAGAGSHSYAEWQDLLFECITDTRMEVEGIARTRCQDSYKDIMLACARWIDRSIKGSVSVEAIDTHKPYRRAVMHLRASVEAAGVDGLGKDAQAVMRVTLGALDKAAGYTQPGLESFAQNSISLESLEQRLAFSRQRPANEGIVDSIKRLFSSKDTNTEAAPSQPVINNLDWWDSNGESITQLNAVTLQGETAGYFVRNGRPISDVGSELRKDVQTYKSLSGKLHSAAQPWVRFFDNLERKFQPFMGNVDHLDEFVKVLESVNASTPKKSIGDLVTWDTASYLGGSRPVGSVSVPALSGNGLTAFKKAMADLLQLIFEVEELESDFPLPFDGTDPPIRGYSDDDRVISIINEARWMMGNFEDSNSDIIDTLGDQLDALFVAMVTYARQASNLQ